MIKKINVNNEVLEIQCDICNGVFDIKEEIAEFMRFDYNTGDGSIIPNTKIKFDVCQDCFVDAFPDYFDDLMDNKKISVLGE